MGRIHEWLFHSSQTERDECWIIYLMCFFCTGVLFICNCPLPLITIQSGTHSASLDKQRQLQSAAHTFYQQVVRVLKHRVQVETEHPGLLFIVNALLLLPSFFIFFYCNFDLIPVISRIMSTSAASHNVCTEFLLPTSGPGVGHQVWHPWSPFHADQQ